MSVQSMGIATTPLAGHALLGVDKTLATLPLFLVHGGVMLTTIPASLLMARIGRRGGFSVGALCGVASGLISVFAIYQQSFAPVPRRSVPRHGRRLCVVLPLCRC